MILDDIIANKRLEIERIKHYFSIEELKERAQAQKPAKDFFEAVGMKGGPDAIRVIAEVKKASPTKGVIRPDFYPYEIAKAYQSAGAVAISMLTDEKFFMGRLDYLTSTRAHMKIPVLRKDFILDVYQVYESRAAGADAILLIASVLEKGLLMELMAASEGLNMGVLVEVHDEDELKTAVDAGAKIIGVNNRDLKTFKTDINTTRRLAKLVPPDRVLVAESGINTHDDVIALKEAGADAFLIGEALLVEPDVGRKLRELLGAG